MFAVLCCLILLALLYYLLRTNNHYYYYYYRCHRRRRRLRRHFDRGAGARAGGTGGHGPAYGRLYTSKTSWAVSTGRGFASADTNGTLPPAAVA